MGSSIYWCRVDAESFKKYLKADDVFDKLEQKLYEKYQATFDADMDRFNREMEEAEEGKRSFKSVKDELPIYKVVSPAEFDKWFTLMRKVNSLKAMSCIDNLMVDLRTKKIRSWCKSIYDFVELGTMKDFNTPEEAIDILAQVMEDIKEKE